MGQWFLIFCHSPVRDLCVLFDACGILSALLLVSHSILGGTPCNIPLQKPLEPLLNE